MKQALKLSRDVIAIFSCTMAMLAVSATVYAEPITFNFEGAFVGGGVAGLAITGSFTFESTAPDNGSGLYPGAISDFSFTTGDSSTTPLRNLTGTMVTALPPSPGIAYPDTPYLIVRNNVAAGDIYSVYIPRIELRSLLGEPVPAFGSGIHSMELAFVDHSGTVFASTAIPLLPPSLAAFDTDSSNFVLSGSPLVLDITSLTSASTPTEVPEPSSVALLGIGVAACGLSRRRWPHRDGRP